jgi:hypothetical protein
MKIFLKKIINKTTKTIFYQPDLKPMSHKSLFIRKALMGRCFQPMYKLVFADSLFG